MKTLVASALVLCLAAPAFAAGKKDGISISFSSDDSKTRLASRHAARDSRLAVTTRNGDVMLLLTNDVIAVQLTDAALAKMETKDDANFLEELVASGVRLAVGKAVEYPIANVATAEVRNGVLVLTNDEGKPLFDEIEINGTNVTRNLTAADAAKFADAFRRVKGKR